MNPIERFPQLEKLLDALRRQTERLGPLDDSALEYNPDQARAE